MAIYAHVTPENNLIGFYDTEVGAPPPFDELGDSLVLVDEEMRDLWIANPHMVLGEDGELFEPLPEPPSKAQLLAHLAAHRWVVETGGIQLNGMTVATDDRSKTMIMGARVAAMANPDHVVNWKMPDGSWMPLDAATITAVSDAVLNHVNSCFEREAEVAAMIEAGDITGPEGVEAAFDA